MDKISETEKAWAAGFFDGEGCTYRVNEKNNRTAIGLSIGQNDIEPLERFNAAIGGLGKIYTRRITGSNFVGSEDKDYGIHYVLRIQSVPKVLEAFDIIKPYLSGIKIEQAEVIIKDLTYTGGCAAKTHCPQGHPYDEQNTYYYTNPKTGKTRRDCRACGNERSKIAKRKARAGVKHLNG